MKENKITIIKVMTVMYPRDFSMRQRSRANSFYAMFADMSAEIDRLEVGEGISLAAAREALERFGDAIGQCLLSADPQLLTKVIEERRRLGQLGPNHMLASMIPDDIPVAAQGGSEGAK